MIPYKSIECRVYRRSWTKWEFMNRISSWTHEISWKSYLLFTVLWSCHSCMGLCARSRPSIFTMVFSMRKNIERGARQGFPLGPYLYILQYEPLKSIMREVENIRWIKICDKNRMAKVQIALFSVCRCYAMLYGWSKINLIWFQHLHTYERASSAVVNFNKSYALLLGILKAMNIYVIK